MSSTQAEYVAASYAAKEPIWLRQMLADMGVSATNLTSIHEDN